MKLNALRPGRGARKAAKRLGRGDASGHGGTSTRGHKGQRARSGGFHKRGFEGGQTPLIRRVPKRGFTNVFREPVAIVNLDQLAEWPAGTAVTIEALLERGMIRPRVVAVKLLGRGEAGPSLTVRLPKISAAARQKIESAGGRVEVGD